MAPLPDIRLKLPLRAFDRVSVDFAGPFITKQGRGKRREKRYLCLFTCLVSRAVHLEMAYGLDTDSFINAFYRMVNRRGLPSEVLSDKGTNLVGAVNELKGLIKNINESDVTQRTSHQCVTWYFNPPAAPHFGGVHESMIKSAKRAVYAILKGADVNDEELMTALTGAEALINSRPLTYQSAHPQDDVPLTPNHLLFGMTGGTFVNETEPYNPQKRWRRVQNIVSHFWKRWMREWLPTLSARHKWGNEQPDIKENDLVVVASPTEPRGRWPLGRVINVHPGRDGHVRVATVRVGKTTLTRPIVKLCPLKI